MRTHASPWNKDRQPERGLAHRGRSGDEATHENPRSPTIHILQSPLVTFHALSYQELLPMTMNESIKVAQAGTEEIEFDDVDPMSWLGKALNESARGITGTIDAHLW